MTDEKLLISHVDTKKEKEKKKTKKNPEPRETSGECMPDEAWRTLSEEPAGVMAILTAVCTGSQQSPSALNSSNWSLA